MMRLVSSRSDLEVAWDEYDSAQLHLHAMYASPTQYPAVERLEQAVITAARWADFRDLMVAAGARIATTDPERSA
jgi:hypothetical protein